MKKRLSIDRIGMRGSIGLLLLGSFLLVFGIILQTAAMKLPDNAIRCTATITALQYGDDSAEHQSPRTFVTYEIDGTVYKDVSLGQFELNWQIGDELEIYCSASDHKHIWTGTMQYQGWLYITVSVSFLLIPIYKFILFRRRRGESDSDIDKSGEEKFKLSSAVIPMLAGIPLIISGILFGIIEKNSVLAIIVVVLGSISILTGVFSLIDYISFVRSKNNSPTPPESGACSH